MDQFWLALLVLFLRIENVTSFCGGDVHVDATTTIKSPNYPNPYPNMARCTWLIRTRDSAPILMHFEDFETENAHDCLEIRNGHLSDSPLVGKYCGGTKPILDHGSTNRLRMTFTTDGSVTFRGFKAVLSKGVAAACRLDQLQCFQETKCLSMEQVCDGKKDCYFGNDENFCNKLCGSDQRQSLLPLLAEPLKLMPEREMRSYSSCNVRNVTIPNAVYNNCHQDVKVAHNSIFTVKCKIGFTKTNTTTDRMRCVNGDWTDIPECTPSCSSPNLPSTVSIVAPYDKTVYFEGEMVLVNCSEGYFFTDGAISPFMTIRCNGKNVWTPKKLICSPKEQFHYVYKPQQEKVLETSFGHALHLPCEFTETTGSDVTEWLWLKDAVDIASKPNLSYTINSANGSLLLPAVALEDVGSYTCLMKNESQYVPTSVMYIVKILAVCLPGPANRTMVVEEYSSAIMFCPDTGAHSQDPPIWYNSNGERIVHDEKFNLLMNIGLLISSVEYSDEGPYVCDVGPNTPFCSKRFTTNLKVIPTTESICGLSTKHGQFPWLVTLWWYDETAPFCYGALVNKQWVVTTALCVLGLHRKRDPGVFVYLGQQNSNENSTIIPVAFARIHPQFNRRNNLADIGVVKLKQPVAYSEDIVPICLSETDLELLLSVDLTVCDLRPSLRGNVSGFGSLETDLDKGGLELMEVYSNAESCMADSGTCQKVPDGTFCAKGCNPVSKYVGDIGSPLQVMYEGKMFLYGLFSFGERRSQISNYDYFTNVTTYYKWVVAKIRG